MDLSKEGGAGGAEHDAGNNFAGSNNHPDSPGLELFAGRAYSLMRWTESFPDMPHL
jgi:hypothetical protein